MTIKGSKDSWKDEAWTILFIIIIAMCFIPPLQPYTERGFDASRTPQWFQFAMYGAIAGSFGLRGMGKVLVVKNEYSKEVEALLRKAKKKTENSRKK